MKSKIILLQKQESVHYQWWLSWTRLQPSNMNELFMLHFLKSYSCRGQIVLWNIPPLKYRGISNHLCCHCLYDAFEADFRTPIDLGAPPSQCIQPASSRRDAQHSWVYYQRLYGPFFPQWSPYDFFTVLWNIFNQNGTVGNLNLLVILFVAFETGIWGPCLLAHFAEKDARCT